MLIHIVDDSRAMRRTVREVLAGLGADFMESADGEAAVRDFAVRRPDYVVMDIRMAPLDGLAATRAILQLAPGARVVMLTNFDDEAMRAAAREAGASAYVLKNDISDLLHVFTPSHEEGSH